MSSDTLAVPAAFQNSAALPQSVLDEVLSEVKSQLTRKFIDHFGTNLNVADGVALYAAEADASKRIWTVRHTKGKEGEPSRKKISDTFGHAYEELEVMHINRHAVINDVSLTAATTDEMADNKSQNEYAKTNHPYVDIVVSNSENGKTVKTLQAKNTKSTRALLEARYTTDPDAPDYIIVPHDQYDGHKDKLDKMIANPNTSETDRERAIAAREKLKRGDATRADSLNPYLATAKQTASDLAHRTAERIGQGMMMEVAVMAIGGAVWEIRDAAQTSGDSITIWERIQRYFIVLYEKTVNAFKLRAGKEFMLEGLNAIMGVLASTFKSLRSFLMSLGKALKQVWDAVYNYITGKITSFSDLVSIILKSVATVGIGALAFSLEGILSSHGIPPFISGLISAALAGVAIVFANRGIDAVVRNLLASISSASAAKLRKEEIEAYCAEALPLLLEESESLERMAKTYYAKRNNILDCNFVEFKQGLVDGEANKVLSALVSINELFGKSISWSTITEFDAMMEDGNSVFVL